MTLLVSAALTAMSCGYRVLPDRFGVYIWGALPPVANPLAAASQDAQYLGVHVVRVCLSPYWDPQPSSGDRFLPLDQKMWRADYREILSSFPVVMITAYDMATYDARYRDRNGFVTNAKWTAALDSVRDEFRRFTFELSKLPNTFIISNWEAENDATDDQWADYMDYLQARLDGIAWGRRKAREAGHPGTVLSAVEFTHVKPGWSDPRLGAPPRKACGLDAALNLRGVDFLSYSAWESIYYTSNPRYTPEQLHNAFSTIWADCQQHLQRCRLIVGEAGYLRDSDPDNSNLGAIFAECLRSGADYIVNWAAYDQPGQVDSYGLNVDESKFGKFDLARHLTSQGTFFRDFINHGMSSSSTRAFWTIPLHGRVLAFLRGTGLLTRQP